MSEHTRLSNEALSVCETRHFEKDEHMVVDLVWIGCRHRFKRVTLIVEWITWAIYIYSASSLEQMSCAIGCPNRYGKHQNVAIHWSSVNSQVQKPCGYLRSVNENKTQSCDWRFVLDAHMTFICLFSHVLWRLFVYMPNLEKVLNTFAACNRMTTSFAERICQWKVPKGGIRKI